MGLSQEGQTTFLQSPGWSMTVGKKSRTRYYNYLWGHKMRNTETKETEVSFRKDALFFPLLFLMWFSSEDFLVWEWRKVLPLRITPIFLRVMNYWVLLRIPMLQLAKRKNQICSLRVMRTDRRARDQSATLHPTHVIHTVLLQRCVQRGRTVCSYF